MKLTSLLIGIFAFALAGCVMPKAYVDPKYSDLNLQTVQIEPGTAYNLNATFQTNGKEKKNVTKTLNEVADKFFQKAGIENSADAPTLNITVNNIADMGNAAGKGAMTGLTLGLAGSTVTDGYEFKFELEGADEMITKNYAHAMHTTIGNTDAPFDNAEPMTALGGFEAIFEDMFLQFIKDTTEVEAIAWYLPIAKTAA